MTDAPIPDKNESVLSNVANKTTVEDLAKVAIQAWGRVTGTTITEDDIANALENIVGAIDEREKADRKERPEYYARLECEVFLLTPTLYFGGGLGDILDDRDLNVITYIDEANRNIRRSIGGRSPGISKNNTVVTPSGSELGYELTIRFPSGNEHGYVISRQHVDTRRIETMKDLIIDMIKSGYNSYDEVNLIAVILTETEMHLKTLRPNGSWYHIMTLMLYDDHKRLFEKRREEVKPFANVLNELIANKVNNDRSAFANPHIPVTLRDFNLSALLK